MEKDVDLGGKYSLSRMMKSGIDDTREADQALLDECKIQGDVQIQSQLPGHDDFRGFDWPCETDSAAISKRDMDDFRNRLGQLLNVIF